MEVKPDAWEQEGGLTWLYSQFLVFFSTLEFGTLRGNGAYYTKRLEEFEVNTVIVKSF